MLSVRTWLVGKSLVAKISHRRVVRIFESGSRTTVLYF